jgi:hypothetical protein
MRTGNSEQHEALIAGGQGRTADEIKHSATLLCIVAIGLGAFVGFLIAVSMFAR